VDTDHTAPPAPHLTDWNRPYFDAAAAGRLVLQLCGQCRKTIYYPRIACPSCLSSELTWEPTSGLGSIYSYTVVWRPGNPAFNPYIPIVIVAVQLDDGPLMIANLEHCDSDAVEIGMAVEVCFSAIEGGPVLPRFRPVNT
jgi:uncharacterized OB-fold protein